MKRDTQNQCADCGAPTANFLCDRCAEICDALTATGEYWHRVRRPGQHELPAELIRNPRRPPRVR